MQTTITMRREEIPEEVLARLAKRAVRPTSAHLTFDSGKTGVSAEIVLNAARGAVYVAKAEAADHRTALDRALAKLQRQLEKAEANPARSRRKAAAS
jgi:ribosome-associated translation inhibitor RaiA